MAAEQVETSKVYARNVARIEPEWIEQCAAHLVKHNYYDPHWEKKSARSAIVQIKLDELISALKDAKNGLVTNEELTQKELETLNTKYVKKGRVSRKKAD